MDRRRARGRAPSRISPSRLSRIPERARRLPGGRRGGRGRTGSVLGCGRSRNGPRSGRAPRGEGIRGARRGPARGAADRNGSASRPAGAAAPVRGGRTAGTGDRLIGNCRQPGSARAARRLVPEPDRGLPERAAKGRRSAAHRARLRSRKRRRRESCTARPRGGSPGRSRDRGVPSHRRGIDRGRDRGKRPRERSRRRRESSSMRGG